MREINLPASDEIIRELRVGESVLLNGLIVTGRDAAHKWLMEKLPPAIDRLFERWAELEAIGNG